MKNFTILLLTRFLGVLTACGEGENREENQYDVKKPDRDSIIVSLEEGISTDNRQLLALEDVPYDPGRKVFYKYNLNRDYET